jgi:SH3-like domain-containing protein
MSQEPAALPNAEMISVQRSGVNIRAAPRRTARVVGSVTKGSRLKVVSRSGKWVEVETDGRSGWISRNMLRPRS